jgi:type IV pilus assembly protein PilP
MWKRVSSISFFLILTACGGDDMSDLETYVEETLEKPGNGIEPLEKVKPSDFFLFEPDNSRNPFLIRKKKIKPKKKPPKTVEKKQAMIEKEKERVKEPVKKPPTALQPDLDRMKEDLESFPLESMSMVGTVKKNGTWALVQFKGGIQKVRAGNYIGQNHGLILEITNLSIKIEEIVQEAEEEDRWIYKQTALSLKTEADEPK